MPNTNILTSSAELPAPVLTAYLDVVPAKSGNSPAKKEYLPWLKKQVKSMSGNVRTSERELFGAQVQKLESYLRDHTPQGKGLVVFAGPSTWELATLQYHVENELHWGYPALTQLEWSLREATPVCVVVADRKGARFFHHALGELSLLGEKKFELDATQWKRKDLGHFARRGIKKTRGSQQDTYQHRVEAQFQRLLRETARFAQELCEKQECAALFLVCSDRLRKPIEDSFTKEFQNRVIRISEDLGSLALPKLQEVLEPHLAEWKQKYETELVDRLVADERNGIVGLEETLTQLQKGKIRTILLAQGFNTSLRQCTECGWTDSSADQVCSSCGRKERHSVEVRRVLPELARNGTAEIQVVSGEAETQLLRAGGIGGWLRGRTRAQLL